MITQGKWIAEKTTDSNGFYTVYTEENSIQLTIATIWDGGTGNAKDNARLIAALPDLLALLQRIKNHLDGGGTIQPENGVHIAIGEAIAKAEG